jgi:hypothetical protein
VSGSKVKGQKNISREKHQSEDFHVIRQVPNVGGGGGSGGRSPAGSTEHTSGVKGQKNISHKNIEISILTLKEGPMVDDRVLPGSKEHQLPGSKVKDKKRGVSD